MRIKWVVNNMLIWGLVFKNIIVEAFAGKLGAARIKPACGVGWGGGEEV